jgi:Ca-activated chloride channel family protein
VNAPDWWTVWSKNTRGAASGTITVALPTTPGIYELRYYLQDSYTLLAKSAPIPVKNNGFTISPAATSVTAGSSITVPWTAGTGRNAADYIGLYPTGGASDQPVAYFDTNGKASGTFTYTAPSTPGTYEFRYILGARNSYTYICIAKSPTITVH